MGTDNSDQQEQKRKIPPELSLAPRDLAKEGVKWLKLFGYMVAVTAGLIVFFGLLALISNNL